MNPEEELAFKKTLEALGKTEEAKNAKKAAYRSLSNFGIDPKDAARAAALAEIVRKKEIKGKIRLPSGFSVEGKVNPEDQQIGVNWSMDW